MSIYQSLRYSILFLFDDHGFSLPFRYVIEIVSPYTALAIKHGMHNDNEYIDIRNTCGKYQRMSKPRPNVRKLFDSENVLKYENQPHDFRETLWLLSNYSDISQ